MTTAFATQPATKAKSRKLTPLGKLLAAHNELLKAWIVSGVDGFLKIRQPNEDSYAVEFCGCTPVNFESITIYQGDVDFEVKKQRILDYLSGKVDCLEEKGEHL